tara:strand:- start:474 stop:689 length:216 start_codon:yes stop_codon:yes gene_type:complete
MYGVNSMVSGIKTIKFKKFGTNFELDIDYTGNFLELALYDDAIDDVNRDSMLKSVNLDTDPIWSESVKLDD